ncbi:MAG: hypothetical protein U5K54_04790 [Cytophagales bacterium]|nr:hypothetical protein [Cytophagales bacterium]
MKLLDYGSICDGQDSGSNDTVVIEGNHYFPEASVKKEFLKSSDTETGVSLER